MVQGRHTRLRVTLTPEARVALEAVLRCHTTPAGLARRVRGVLLAADGQPLRHVAQTIGLARRILYLWLRRYQTEGLRGLQDRRAGSRTLGELPRPGRPPRWFTLSRQFLYAPRQVVAWAEHPGQAWQIAWQRITYREASGLGPIVDYGLERVEAPHPECVWALEPDLEPWEDRPCP